MSADNWGICPRCKVTAEQKQVDLIRRAGEAYGKVQPYVYLKMRQDSEKPLVLESTFREDYEVGAYLDGTFMVSYRGACQTCGLSFDFKHECNIPGAMEPIRLK